MPFTEEQEKLILDYVTKQSSSQPAQEKQVATQETQTEQTLAAEAKAAIEAEKASSVALSQIQESIKFNLSVNEFVEKNKNLLPEEAAKIISAANSKNFKDDNEKANVLRKNLLDSFLSQQDNISVLTPSLMQRANEFKSLAESDKERRSAEFWDLAEVGTALKAGARKAEALNKINGVAAGDSSSNILEAKILAAAKQKFNKKQ